MLDAGQFRTPEFYLMLVMTAISSAMGLEIVPPAPSNLWHKLAALALFTINFTLYGYHRRRVNMMNGDLLALAHTTQLSGGGPPPPVEPPKAA